MDTNISPTLASPQVAAQDQLALKQVWENIQPDSCPYSYNFHMHTRCSDGQLQPEALIEQAISIGLKGLAITDHHTVAGYYAAQSFLEQRQQSLPSGSVPHLWTGVEITSHLLVTDVHILGYAFDPMHPSLQPYLHNKPNPFKIPQAAKVITAIQQAGGLAVLAHPARYRRPPEKLIPAAADLGIDGVETYYAYGNPKPWQPSSKRTQKVKQLSATYKLFNTCGTDTHGLNLLWRV
ncbi:MAG: PHP domain-containing protein [Symploca sp. SIO1C2]|nr:PHP domain-containing protein [Symploca sp. SIO1C2]NER51354.1 PHP domain-containing protein [Symploca sp. SIO1A3]